ncbi:MAG TPA: hypothetical protein DCE43_01445 [Planctomycetaceae bacterium]|nr:hypothetical protein [Planctomycetaceae bacterium]|tara:strand:+ start:66 stop:1364 length:1299 start_codon:yes stop_codon:yes gene_type:complete
MQQDFFPEHHEVSRRYFLRRSLELGGGAACIGASGLNDDLLGDEGKPTAAKQVTLDALVKKLEFLTKPAAFGTVERGNPLPYKLPPEKLKTAGLTRESWRLEVLADPASNAQVTRPLRLADGTALTFDGLMKMAEKHSVRFLKTMTCNNEDAPLGTGLWEGVPLREVIWTAKPTANIRRAWFYGYHNEDPKQEFRGSLSIGRILEDPPGVPPVILCYKLNGDWISGKRGGPVRMVIPECYGFKNIKWLTKVFLTNRFNANDTYAAGNNDIDSLMKTMARFISKPRRGQAGQPIPLTGFAQVGVNGVSKVQAWLHPKDKPLPKDDPFFQKAPWRDMDILPAPGDFGGGLPAGTIGPDAASPVHGFNSKTGRPESWPRVYALAHWAGLLPGVPAGRYDLRCRAINNQGIAQPLPRPFRKSGHCDIERVSLVVRD